MASKSVRLTIKNDRIRLLEERQERIESVVFGKLDELSRAIQGIKENELEHIYGEMKEIQLAQTSLRNCYEKTEEFQAEMKGSTKMLKWIIGVILGLLPVLVKIVDMVIK